MAETSLKQETVFKGAARLTSQTDDPWPATGDQKSEGHPLLDRGFNSYSNDIHSSCIDLLQLCPRRFLYEERFHLQPKGEYSESLHVGTVFHLAKKALLDGESYETTARIVAQEVTRLQDEALESCDALGMLPNGEAFTSFQNKLQKDTTLGLALCQYVHEEHPWPEPDRWQTIATELPIRARWDSLVSFIKGTLDHIVYDKKKNELWIVDHKTTSFDPVDAAAEYKISVQPPIYRLLLALAHESLAFSGVGVPDDAVVAGVVHNCITKPTIRQKKTETYEEYVNRCGEWLRDNSTYDHPPFVRSWIRFHGPILSDEIALRLREADAAERVFPELSRFFRNSKACRSFNRLCPFHALCTKDPAHWDDLLEYRYTIQHRDDTDTDPTEFVTIGGYKHGQ